MNWLEAFYALIMNSPLLSFESVADSAWALLSLALIRALHRQHMRVTSDDPAERGNATEDKGRVSVELSGARVIDGIEAVAVADGYRQFLSPLKQIS